MNPEDELKALEEIDSVLYEPDLSVLTKEELLKMAAIQDKYHDAGQDIKALSPEELDWMEYIGLELRKRQK